MVPVKEPSSIDSMSSFILKEERLFTFCCQAFDNHKGSVGHSQNETSPGSINPVAGPEVFIEVSDAESEVGETT